MIRRSKIKIIIFTLLISIIIFIGLIIKNLFIGNTTVYCPLSHKINSDITCKICDKLDNRVLVYHVSISHHIALFSIHGQGKTIWFEHPANCSPEYMELNNDSGNVVKLIPNCEDSILFNGHKIKILCIK